MVSKPRKHGSKPGAAKEQQVRRTSGGQANAAGAGAKSGSKARGMASGGKTNAAGAAAADKSGNKARETDRSRLARTRRTANLHEQAKEGLAANGDQRSTKGGSLGRTGAEVKIGEQEEKKGTR